MNRETVAENNLLCEELLECLPEYCEYCDSEIHFDDGLRMYCSNKDCPSKVAERIYNMARYIQVDGFGFATNLRLAKELNLKSPLDLFRYTSDDEVFMDMELAAIQKKMDELQEMRKKTKFQLSDIVKMAALDGINTLADKIFKGYTTFAQFYDDLGIYGVGFLAEKLIVGGQATQMVMAIYETLLDERENFLSIEEDGLFAIESLDGKVVEIAITGNLANGLTKKKFIASLNEKLAPKFHLVLSNTVSKNINVLIADNEDSSSSKMKTALKLQEKGHDIEIMTSEQFVREMERLL